MSYKLFLLGLLLCAMAFSASSQKIVVDSTSTNKYLVKPTEQVSDASAQEELTFSDRALSIGKGILNRLKARLNLEEAAESIKDKKNKILGKGEEKEVAKKEGG
ncbi:hypothetical protein [Ekhidna sp.]|uniref:hypothetical protein n=1 Tax=Ekhidna sp. TaxID=2608089 RepID=UPI0032977846